MTERPKSASELQIEEKKKRLDAMLWLAKNETINEIIKTKHEEPDIEEEVLKLRLKTTGIPIILFLNEYIKSGNDELTGVKTSVSYEIARGYFNSFSKCLHPVFITFNPYRKPKHTHFHLSESWLDIVLDKVLNPKKIGEEE